MSAFTRGLHDIPGAEKPVSPPTYLYFRQGGMQHGWMVPDSPQPTIFKYCNCSFLEIYDRTGSVFVET